MMSWFSRNSVVSARQDGLLRGWEERARELGATSLGLHVFGHNEARRQLYEQLGFMATNILMTKKLAGE
jgi:ribosomal protein S18 acetylase RimI-like enzyme